MDDNFYQSIENFLKRNNISFTVEERNGGGLYVYSDVTDRAMRHPSRIYEFGEPKIQIWHFPSLNETRLIVNGINTSCLSFAIEKII